MKNTKETQEELENRLWVENGLVDKLCKDMYGHSNWQYISLDKDPDGGLSLMDLPIKIEEGGTCIIFFKEPDKIIEEGGWKKL